MTRGKSDGREREPLLTQLLGGGARRNKDAAESPSLVREVELPLSVLDEVSASLPPSLIRLSITRLR